MGAVMFSLRAIVSVQHRLCFQTEVRSDARQVHCVSDPCDRESGMNTEPANSKPTVFLSYAACGIAADAASP